MKNKIQIIINIFTIINIILILLLGYKMIINNKYSRKYVYELIEKNGNTNNYIIVKERYSFKYGEKEVEKIIQKENARRVEQYGDNYETMTLYANDFAIHMDERTYSKIKGQKVDENGNETDVIVTTKEIISLHPLKNEFDNVPYIDSDGYKYLNKEKYNGVNCIKIQLIKNEESYVIMWIDMETGFVLKEEKYNNEGVLECITTYKTNVNNVTDREIDFPDLNTYRYIDREKNNFSKGDKNA